MLRTAADGIELNAIGGVGLGVVEIYADQQVNINPTEALNLVSTSNGIYLSNPGSGFPISIVADDSASITATTLNVDIHSHADTTIVTGNGGGSGAF